jgi:hypothetical protein
MAAPNINTYHCLCTSLVLATTHDLALLPRRDLASSSDGATILPIPLLPSNEESDLEALPSQDQSLPEEGYTLLLSLIADKRATIVRRSDGFEKRVLYRCGRCAVTVGYEIREAPQVDAEAAEKESAAAASTRTKVLYLLRGGLSTTDFMAKGKKIQTEMLEKGSNAKEVVAAWQ